MSGANACTSAPEVNIAPAISTVRSRPIWSANSPPASEPNNAPSVTQLVTTSTSSELSENVDLIPAQRPGDDALIVAEQCACKENDDQHHPQPWRHGMAGRLRLRRRSGWRRTARRCRRFDAGARWCRRVSSRCGFRAASIAGLTKRRRPAIMPRTEDRRRRDKCAETARRAEPASPKTPPPRRNAREPPSANHRWRLFRTVPAGE